MIDKLEFFLVLSRVKHFGRAAEECGISQPSLSAAIKQLEDQLGVSLVMRGSRYQGLTPEGERVVEWARRIVGDARSLKEEMRAVRKGLSGHIRLAVIPTALAMVQKLTEPFQAKHPDVNFSIMSRNSLQILEQLENLEIDAGMTYLDNEPLGRVFSLPLYTERYHLICSPKMPLPSTEELSWADVATLPLCLLTADMQNRRIIDQHLAKSGLSARPTIESNSMIVLFSHIRTGKWAAIMPREIAQTFGTGSDIRIIPIKGPEAQHQVGMIAPHREPHTPLVAALLQEARLNLTDMIDR